MNQVIRLVVAVLLSVTAMASTPFPLRQENIRGSADFTTIDPRSELFLALTKGNYLDEQNPTLKPSARERLELLRRGARLGDTNFPEPTTLPGTLTPPGTTPTVPGANPTGTLPNRPTNPLLNARELEGFLGRDIVVARVSDEFKCDLFGNNPYTEMDTSLNSLIDAMKIQPDCKDSVNRVEQIQKTNEQIQTQIQALQQILTAENAGANSPSIATAANSAQSIALLIQSNYSRITENPILNSRCESYTKSVPQMIKSVSDLASNSAPLVMMALSLAPSIAVSTKLVAVAGTVLASMASGIAETAIREGIDYSKETNRRAVVQNICQFTKIYRKYKIIQMARSSDLDAIQIILNNEVTENELALEYTDPALVPILTKRGNFEKNIGKSINAISKINFELANAEANERFKASDNPADRCSFFYEEIFAPGTSEQLNVYAETPKALQSTAEILGAVETVPLFAESGRLTAATLLRQRLAEQNIRRLEEKKIALENVLSGAVAPNAEGTTDVSEQIFKTCETTAKEIFDDTKKMAAETQSILRAVNETLNRQMRSTTETKIWQDKYLSFRNDVMQLQGLWKLIQDVRDKANPLISTDVSIKIDQVRKNLLGDFNSNWSFRGGSAAYTWINFQISAFNVAMNSFEALLGQLQVEASHVLKTRTGPPPYRNEPGLKNQYNEQMALHGSRVANLDILKDAAGANVNFKRNLCQKLLASYIEFAKARDFFNSSRFMCTMIREELPTAERSLQNLCQPSGVLLFADKTEPSGLNKEILELNQAQARYGNLSTMQMLKQVAGIAQHLECHSVIQIPDITKTELSEETGLL